MKKVTDELTALLPDLALWNDGRGISAMDWLLSEPKMDLPVAYSSLFWPRFVAVGPYVLREGFDPDSLKAWEKSGEHRRGIEGAMNVIDTLDLLVPVGEAASKLAERQAVYIGGVLADIHRVKLAQDFPNNRFTVEFWDGTQAQGDDISLSFWQNE
ncbi:MAG: hypothetical protein V4707_08100 [Pseudomonadota bacterium]